MVVSYSSLVWVEPALLDNFPLWTGKGTLYMDWAKVDTDIFKFDKSIVDTH